MGRRPRARPAALAALALLAAAPAAAGPRRTYANPIDIDYRYNFEQRNEGLSYRTGADPAIVRHRGAYYLFQTLADGYWRSTNLVDWRFIVPSRWPLQSVVAPAAWSDGARLYLMPSTDQPGSILVSDDPAHGKLDFLSRRTPDLPGMVGTGFEGALKPGQVPPGPIDPALFRDDDGRWYLYWGSSNVYPIYGIELDPKARLGWIGRPRPLIRLDPERHGWERFGPDHSGGLPDGTPIKPFIEGAWMTRAQGRYYLQYAAPGTEYNAYATGTYVADSPLGPFAYAPYNPVADKPGGFVQGAGHGSTFQDAHGNWWTSGTAWVGLNWPFERRIDLFPARFEADGQMEVSTRFGDFPHYAADRRVADPESLFTGWMLLSYRKRATASSTLDGFTADRATDEDPRSFWVAARNRPGETLTVDLGAVDTVRAIQVNFADYRSERFADAPDVYTAFQLEGSADGRRWRRLARTGAPRRDRPNAYFALARPAKVRFVRYVHGHVGAAHLAISDLRVFGAAAGPPPPAPARVTATRGPDGRDALVRWTRSPGAVGYNVRWGVRPDRLASTYQRFETGGDSGADAALQLRSLTVGQAYFVAVETFDERGVSPLSGVVTLPASTVPARP